MKKSALVFELYYLKDKYIVFYESKKLTTPSEYLVHFASGLLQYLLMQSLSRLPIMHCQHEKVYYKSLP